MNIPPQDDVQVDNQVVVPWLDSNVADSPEGVSSEGGDMPDSDTCEDGHGADSPEGVH